jgi:predicted nucleic acid-binding protein
LGLAINQTARGIARIKRLWTLSPELPITAEWERIVKSHGVVSKNAHDARLVAAMHVHSVRNILTFNVKDFVRYRDITVLDPAAVS